MSRILWVEDAHEAIKALVRPLEQSGNKIVAVRDVASAVDKLHGREPFDLVIVDMLLPHYEFTEFSLPNKVQASLSAGSIAGEALIEYMRRELGLRIPIIVLTVLAHSGDVRERLDPYEISGYYEKGPMTPERLKEIVVQALDDPAHERAVLLDLRSKHPEEREVGLEYLAELPLSPRLHAALMGLVESEDVPELQAKAATILGKHSALEQAPSLGAQVAAAADKSPPSTEGAMEEETVVEHDQQADMRDGPHVGPTKEADGPAAEGPSFRVLWLLVGILGTVCVVILLNKGGPGLGPVEIFVLVALAAVVTLGIMGVLFPERVTKLLLAIIGPMVAFMGPNKDEFSVSEEPTADDDSAPGV